MVAGARPCRTGVSLSTTGDAVDIALGFSDEQAVRARHRRVCLELHEAAHSAKRFARELVHMKQQCKRPPLVKRVRTTSRFCAKARAFQAAPFAESARELGARRKIELFKSRTILTDDDRLNSARADDFVLSHVVSISSVVGTRVSCSAEER